MCVEHVGSFPEWKWYVGYEHALSVLRVAVLQHWQLRNASSTIIDTNS